MDNYYITEKFTLVPQGYGKIEYLKELFTIEEDEKIFTRTVANYNATLIYAATQEDKEPLIKVMIENLHSIKEHNKIIVHYNRSGNRTYITAAEGDKLLLANSYRTTDTKNVLYFITLVCGQIMFNPQLTTIHYMGELGEELKQLIATYYQGTDKI